MEYERLYERILNEVDLSSEVEDEKLQEFIHDYIQKEAEEHYISLRKKAILGKELFNAFRKLDILQDLLEDPDITEIMINGTDHIFVEIEGRMVEVERRAVNKTKLEDMAQQIVSSANRIVNEANPIVDTRLEDGSRVNIVLSPVAINGPIITIRKFSKTPLSVEELEKLEALNEELSLLLKKLVISQYNILVSGGTGSG